MENLLLNAPLSFLYCFKEECSKNKNCLHYQAGLVQTKRPIISAVNPRVSTNKGDVCPYFKIVEIKDFVKGMKRLFDEVPAGKVDDIRNELIAHFGKTAYYRYINGEKLLTEEEQTFISQTFHKHGVSVEPQYDEHCKDYNWAD